VLQRAFRLGVTLIVILLVGSVLAGLTYRALANKLTAATQKPLERNL
jgi:Na+-translocating ferredoxin:NAD+ oxidoreductase RnfG subunit